MPGDYDGNGKERPVQVKARQTMRKKLRRLIAAALEGASAFVMPTDYEASGKPKQGGGYDYTVHANECSLCNHDSRDTGLLCAECVDKAADHDDLVGRMRWAMRSIRARRDMCLERAAIADTVERILQETVADVLSDILKTHFEPEITEDLDAKLGMAESRRQADAAMLRKTALTSETEVTP